MRRNKTILFIFGLSITFVLFFSVVLHSQVIGNSINGNANSLIPHSGDSDELYALNGAFNVTEGLSWVNEFTVINNTYLATNLTVGDRLRFTITDINISTVDISGSPNTGETVFSKIELFNSTSGDWDFDPSQPESLLSIYNSTDNLNLPSMLGTYKWYTPLIEASINFFHAIYYDCIPSDFSAANHTIVNTTYTLLTMGGSTTFNHVFTPGVSSNWTIWNGTAGNDGSEPGTYKMVFVFNNMGVCTLSQLYKNGTSWDLILEIKNLRMGPSYPFDLGNILGTYKYKVTKADPSGNVPVLASVGDTFRSTVHNIFNFDIGGGEFADFANGSWSYYNSTDGTTLKLNNLALSVYNNTKSFSAMSLPFQYYSEELDAFMNVVNSFSFNFIPLDFFAANHTIVNITRFGLRMGDPATEIHYNYSQDLSTNNIAGTWTIWNGTAGNDGTESNTILMTITFNSQGVRTTQRMYSNGTTGWKLMFEMVLEEEGEALPIGLLLAMFGGGGGIGMTEILIIALIAGIAVIVLIIAITKARG